MNKIHHILFDQERDRSFGHSFSLKEKGIYCVRIIAQAKSWWQNTKTGRSFLQKDSLALRIDEKEIFPASPKKRLRASDLWNGNVLKGHELTVYILLALDEGTHTFLFDVHGKPHIGELSIFLVSEADIVVENLECSPRDRIPFLTFLIGEGVSLSSLSIAANVKKTDKDDDDLRLLIDGVIEKNTDTNAHRDWYWCGKILKGSSKTFTRSFAKNQSPQRFDLDGDEAPKVDKIVLELANDKPYFPLPHPYKPGQRGEDYNKYDSMIGEVVHYWNEEFLKKEQPVPKFLDPSLVKAIAYIESRLGYGQDVVGYASYPDVMQVGDTRNPAIHVLQTEKNFEEYEWDDNRAAPLLLRFDSKVEINDPRDSVHWAVRWLYHKAQYIQDNQRKWKSWDEAVEGYHKKGDIRYRNNVMKVFRKGIDHKGIQLWTLFYLLVCLFVGQEAFSLCRIRIDLPFFRFER